jgi:hypothetical protein
MHPRVFGDGLIEILRGIPVKIFFECEGLELGVVVRQG